MQGVRFCWDPMRRVSRDPAISVLLTTSDLIASDSQDVSSGGFTWTQDLASIALQHVTQSHQENLFHVVLPLGKNRDQARVADPQDVGQLVLEEVVTAHHHTLNSTGIDSWHVIKPRRPRPPQPEPTSEPGQHHDR